MHKPALLLLPNLLGEHAHHELFLASSVDKAMQTIDGLIAESEKQGRRYLSRFKTKKPPNEMPIALFNEHVQNQDIDFLLEPLRKGERWGLISDAGIPCVADPGYNLVRRAREFGIPIQAFIGPCSITLALMLSGLPGQHFTFHGYLHKSPERRREQIASMEAQSKKEGYTHIFMEAPYRNQHTLQSVVETCADGTWLATAWDLTLPTQGVVSQRIEHWKKSPLPNLEKRNLLFLLNAYE